MLIKSQDGNTIFCFGAGCFLRLTDDCGTTYLLAYASTDICEDGVVIGRYQHIEDARTILDGILDSYTNGAKFLVL